MGEFKKLYRNKKWFEFAENVKIRDSFKCVRCGRGKYEVVLQVHHQFYIKDLKPWEYSLSDCITLCRGCHAEEHSKVEPRRGWTLISMNDLGDLIGTCEREGCEAEIRYEYEAYHPKCGYRVVGSSCIEFLTKEYKDISLEILKLYKNISNFVHKSVWVEKVVDNKSYYVESKYKHHRISIYKKNNIFYYQIGIKRKGLRRYDWKKEQVMEGKNINQVKELAYIATKGLTSNNNEEINTLREIYIKLR